MRFATIIILTLLTSRTFGQETEITVRVIDRMTSEPIKNANVVVLGTTRGTVSNALGFFKLTLGPSEKKLVISHVTYKTEPITVPDGITSFTVPLEKMEFMLPLIDLHKFPTKFKLSDVKPKKTDEDSGPDSLIVVESLAYFPYEGGVEIFSELFGNEFQFPEKELLDKTEGRQILNFTIDKNGDYKNVRCQFDTTSAFCAEFKRIITKMPKWIPGEQRGGPMEQNFAMRIIYGMNSFWKKKIKEIRKQGDK